MYAKIRCWSDSSGGELSDCAAFVSEKALKKLIQANEQYNDIVDKNDNIISINFKSNYCPDLYCFSDSSNEVSDFIDIYGESIEIIEDEPESFYDEEIRVRVFNCIIEVTSMGVYFKMSIKHSDIDVYTNTIDLETAKKLLAAMEED